MSAGRLLSPSWAPELINTSPGAVTSAGYFVPVHPGVLALSFATSAEPRADALVLLFDAIAKSLRWMR